MESFLVTVIYSSLPASMLVALVILGRLNATLERQDAPTSVCAENCRDRADAPPPTVT
jgi:hypothetical protein